jgi:hypothetical protein
MLLQTPFLTNDGVGMIPLDTQLLVLLFVKLLLLLGALAYLVFAFVVVRQVQVMRSTLVTPLANVIQIFGFLHLLFALGVLILFATVL